MKKLIAMLVVLLFFIFIPVSAETGQTENQFACPGSCPTGMASDGTNLYLADRKSDQIYQVSPETGKVISRFNAPGYRPEGLAFDGKYLWMVDSEEMIIHQINLKTHVTEKTIGCPARSPRGLAWDGKYLWLADQRAKKLLQVSIEDGTTIKELPSPSSNPTGVAFDGTYLWVSDRRADRIYMVWPETGEVIIMFKAPDKYPWGLAFLKGKLFCADYQSDQVYAIKTEGKKNWISINPVSEDVIYTHQFRNYGPGTVRDLNIYIAIPENSPRQELISPLAYSSSVIHQVKTDQWGQKVAKFHFKEVKQGEMVSASYQVSAKVYDYWQFVRPEKLGELKDIPKDIKKKYLKNDTKFDFHSKTIREAIKKSIGDETNPYWKMRKIFRYIINNMYYELAGGWNIAPAVLERGNGSCSEYSFVFIAMCRAAGLPARYAGSVVQRGDLASEDEVFHRWCEVYLPGYGWYAIDPSGGDSEVPEAQTKYIGHVSSRFLVTTKGGGGSRYLGWEYNSYATYKSEGICKVHVEKIAEWSPIQ
jgi:outer membrane protein assembly factor BamB